MKPEHLPGQTFRLLTRYGNRFQQRWNYSFPLPPTKPLPLELLSSDITPSTTINTAKEKTQRNCSLKSHPINQRKLPLQQQKLPRQNRMFVNHLGYQRKTIASSAEINLMPLIGSCVPGVLLLNGE